MGNQEEADTDKTPADGKPVAKAPVEDPRDDLRDQLIKHRAQMQRFFDARLRGTIGRRPPW